MLHVTTNLEQWSNGVLMEHKNQSSNTPALRLSAAHGAKRSISQLPLVSRV
jgi:hypothetical protein